MVEAQTRTPGKIVTIFEPWAQIIRKGKLDRPTEFGVVVKVQEAEGGIVTDVAVDDARADALLLCLLSSTTSGCLAGCLRRSLPIAASTPAEASDVCTTCVLNIRCFPRPVTVPESASRMNGSAGSSEDAHGEPGAKRAFRD